MPLRPEDLDINSLVQRLVRYDTDEVAGGKPAEASAKNVAPDRKRKNKERVQAVVLSTCPELINYIAALLTEEPTQSLNILITSELYVQLLTCGELSAVIAGVLSERLADSLSIRYQVSVRINKRGKNYVAEVKSTVAKPSVNEPVQELEPDVQIAEDINMLQSMLVAQVEEIQVDSYGSVRISRDLCQYLTDNPRVINFLQSQMNTLRSRAYADYLHLYMDEEDGEIEVFIHSVPDDSTIETMSQAVQSAGTTQRELTPADEERFIQSLEFEYQPLCRKALALAALMDAGDYFHINLGIRNNDLDDQRCADIFLKNNTMLRLLRPSVQANLVIDRAIGHNPEVRLRIEKI